MPKSVNKVILIGNLGKDPEMKYTPQGTPVARLTLATNERFKDKDGNWQDRAEWHSVICWARLAEIAVDYLKAGHKVYIEGRLQTRSWDDKQTGQKKSVTEIVASDVILLGTSKKSAATVKENGKAAAGGTAIARAVLAPASTAPATTNIHGVGITNEDVPF
jgi:single-strand DNA-binding protein